VDVGKLSCGHTGTLGLPCTMCRTQRFGRSVAAPTVPYCPCGCQDADDSPRSARFAPSAAQRENGRRQSEARLQDLPGRALLDGDTALKIIRRRYASP
jgi:hypothetical protein